jgi:hypothetical protein
VLLRREVRAWATAQQTPGRVSAAGARLALRNTRTPCQPTPLVLVALPACAAAVARKAREPGPACHRPWARLGACPKPAHQFPPAPMAQRPGLPKRPGQPTFNPCTPLLVRLAPLAAAVMCHCPFRTPDRIRWAPLSRGVVKAHTHARELTSPPHPRHTET